MNKPRDKWCQNCAKNSCAIYNSRPDDCREFNCMWLKVEKMPDQLRPDRCGFVVSTTKDDDMVQVNVDASSTRLDDRLPQVIKDFRTMGLRVLEIRGDMARVHVP